MIPAFDSETPFGPQKRGFLAYEQGQTKTTPAFKPQWENLRRLFAGEIPVIVHTYDGWGVMQTARMFAGEYQLKTIATHTAYAGHLVASDVAKYKNVVPTYAKY